MNLTRRDLAAAGVIAFAASTLARPALADSPDMAVKQALDELK